MSGELSQRSNLIDVTYNQLHSILSGHLEGIHVEQIAEYLAPRKVQFANTSEPFGKPSDASRKKIDSDTITLPDGVVVRVEDAEKDFVFAISERFLIDEVNSLILFRSFLYNGGLPSNAESTSTTTLVAELVEAIAPFYYSERLSLFRCLIPMFRSLQNDANPIHDATTKFLAELIPDHPAFAQSLITEYMRKTQDKPPENMSGDQKYTARWAKQNNKEQLVLLEVLFWTMWDFVPCTGPLVESIFKTAYETRMGVDQANATLLLDDEATQLRRDCAALWIIIMVEVLELETIGESGMIEISSDPVHKDIYTASPDSLRRIHEMVTSHTDGQYVCIYLAWAFVLSRLAAKASELKAIPESYKPFFESILPNLGRSYSEEREPIHAVMTTICLHPEAGLFTNMSLLLEDSPLFVTAAAWKKGSSVTDPNATAFRSVFKGLVVALVELVPVERIPEIDKFTEVWVTLFGRSESASVGGICAQYWQSDWEHNLNRRATFDVARSRFPIQFRPLVRLLRAMTAYGFLDTDPLSIADHSHEGLGLSPDRDVCDNYAFFYMDKLTTFSQVIPVSACTGAHALYERQQERYGSNPVSTGLTYINLRPIKLPGGSILPARSTGRLLSGDGGDGIVVCWEHEHSGWKLILEVLTDYIHRKRRHSGSRGAYQDVSFNRKSTSQMMALRLEDIGVELGGEGDAGMITDCLDLVRSLIQDNPAQAEQLMLSLETGEPVVAHTTTESQAPDLVQLTTMILEEALSRTDARSRAQPHAGLITSAMSVLSALLALPNYSNRVWLYIRSTTALFRSDQTAGFASVALAAERTTGHYTMTLALLHLVQQLFHEAASSVLPETARLQQLKEDVLLRAARFVHTEIWVEHLGWKYTQLGDRFEIGRRITALYLDILQHAPPALEERPFVVLSQSVIDVLLSKATHSTINPLVSSINSGLPLLRTLYACRRFADARRLIFLLESHLRLVRVILNYKQKLYSSSKPCLLEQALCARVSSGSSSHASSQSKVDSIDTLALYAKGRDLGNNVPVEAVFVLHALCASLSSSQPSPAIIGHLSDPEATVASFVRIVQHPYDELSLRNAVWNFMSLAVDKQPALANLFVTGKFPTPTDSNGGQKAESNDKAKPMSAMDVARDILTNWRDIWELNPQLLSSVLRFLDMVWQHGLEHKATLAVVRSDPDFWDQMTSIACEEIGPIPDYETTSYEAMDGVRRSNLHSAVVVHCYRTVAKSYAIHILGLDIGVHIQLQGRGPSVVKPYSYVKMETKFKSQEELNDLICEAAPSSYDPKIYDQLLEQLKVRYDGLTLDQLRSQEPLEQREFGDSFVFSPSLLRSRLVAYAKKADGMMDDTETSVEMRLLSINLNLSLAHSQRNLAESWQFLFQQTVPYLRGDPSVRPIILAISATISYDIAGEQRSGDMMAMIHGIRLSLLLSMLEVAWFSHSEKPNEIQSFMELVRNVYRIITNDSQPPAKSFLGALSTPFHRTILQIMYFCSRQCRSLAQKPKALNPEQRLTMTSMVEASLHLVIDALKLTFQSARSRADPDLDCDMELLVAVFEQCTHRDVSPSSTLWLTQCQETDIIRESLNLYVHIDLVGLSDLPLLIARKQPLYAPHILYFHMALVNHPSAAERLASDGVLAVYSNNFITPAISAGLVDVVLPELPGEQSPAHRAYCSMLAIVAGVITALGRHNHYFDAEACGFVQLYADQISRVLSWTIGDPITFAFIEEMEQVVHLFQAFAESAPSSANTNPTVDKLLRVFTNHAHQLLQQINYAISHPNHLTSLFEPLTAEERTQYEKDPPSIEPLKRPMIAYLVHRFYRLSGNILSTLITISRAESVLLGRQEEWPVNEALIVPHSKVVLGEPASMGTLLELGNSTLDVLRELVHHPAGQNLTVSTPSFSGTYAKPLDVLQGTLTVRRNLEGVLLYAVTQLVIWLSKPEFEMPSMEEEDSQAMEVQRMDGSKDRRPPRPSISLGERLRRGMTGEMAADLQSLLNKSKPIIAKSETILGKGNVDLTVVLSSFLHERIIVPA